MNVVDVHNRIKTLADERGLSPYELAKRSGMALSSLYNMFERGTMPKLDTLEKLCKGLDVSLSDFFLFLSKPHSGGYMSEKDITLLELSRGLNERNMDRLLVYAQGMMEAQNENGKRE